MSETAPSDIAHLAGLIGRVEAQVDNLTHIVQGNGKGEGLVTQVALLRQSQHQIGADVAAIRKAIDGNSTRRLQFWGPVAASFILAVSSMAIAIWK